MFASPQCTCCSVLFSLVLVLLPSAVRAEPDDPVQVSTERMKTIHKALIAYEKKHQQWPNHLSDLVPEFLPDKSALLDPADPRTGNLGSNQAHKDPKFHVSYSYERNANASRGLPCPLGEFPKPDIPGAAWGSWRHVNGHLEYYFGDQVPLLRCFLHRPAEEDREPGKDLVLNLTPSGRIYRSDFEWDKHPESIAFMLRTLQRDLTQGAAPIRRRWALYRLDQHLYEYFHSYGTTFDQEQHGSLLRGVVERLFAWREQFPGEQRVICTLAGRVHLRLGEYEQALVALETCRKYPGDPKPLAEWQLQAEAHRGLKQWDKLIAVLEALLAERPGTRNYMFGLADAYAAKGDKEKAEDWRKKADPGALLVGKPAPDFRVTLMDGGSLTLAEVRKDKKALLLNFWFCSCQPCRLEFPHLQDLYKAHKDGGLEIVAVNFGDEKEAVAKFVAGKHSFPVCLDSGKGRDRNAIFKAYHVSGYPTNYLIDGEGRVVWRGEGFGPDMKKELAAALSKLGVK